MRASLPDKIAPELRSIAHDHAAHQSAAVGEVGDDGFGLLVREGLKREKIDVTNLQVTAGARTPVAGVVVDRAGEQVQVYVVRLLKTRLCDTPLASGLLISDYLNRTCTELGQDIDWLADQVRVPVVHSLLPSSRHVAAIILQRLAHPGA